MNKDSLSEEAKSSAGTISKGSVNKTAYSRIIVLGNQRMLSLKAQLPIFVDVDILIAQRVSVGISTDVNEMFRRHRLRLGGFIIVHGICSYRIHSFHHQFFLT